MGYGYSTARELANKVLLSMGMKDMLSDSDFANTTATDQYQRQAIIFLEMVQKRFALNCNSSRFMQRKFTFTTNAVDTQYEPDPTDQLFPIEGFKPNSFFNVTASGANNQRLHVATWSQWREAYPRPDDMARGFPSWLIPVPEDGTDKVKVLLFPYPNGVYTIEGQGRLEAPDLTSGAQKLLFPKKYEHLLFTYLKIFLEQSVNEGRHADWGPMAEQIFQEVIRDALGAAEETEQIDIGIQLWSRHSDDSRRDYNPATDTVPPFNP
ncbi:MAG TPA: hypothetical protein EYN91_25435 [Candidatus Melainabacteria bacterium]|jgi:hypothetical protein|nr:hypothetical protein [Candidatus Melainabacteria bacterium]HIN66572.1 hypothetical protein [Candidatus Obscuribacterales bacterium]